MENEEKVCSNCKFARQHYVIGIHGYFVKLPNVMDCIHGKITKKVFRKIFKAKSACEYWETCQSREQENAYKIETTLRFISDRLDKIIKVLESDSK